MAKHTETIRVDTHKAKTGGMLISTDETPTFQPNVTKASVALKSFVEGAPDADFKQEYDRRKHLFYQSNTTDDWQEHKEWFELGPMKAHAHVTWVDTPTPWYASGCAQCLAAADLHGSVLAQGDGQLHGQADGHIQEEIQPIRGYPQTPQNLRNIAASRSAESH